MIASKIAGVGTYIPEKKITNQDVLELLYRNSRDYLNSDDFQRLDERAKSLLQKAGSQTRYWAADDEYCSDIAREAANKAVSSANIDVGDIDLIIFTGVSKALIEPATGHILRKELGAKNANVIDTQDACTSFMKSIDIADSLIKTGKYETVLIASGDRVHEFCDFRCKTVDELEWKFAALTLGDCGSAIIVQKTDDPLYSENYHHMKTFFQIADNTYHLCHIGLNYRIGDVNKIYSSSSALFRTAMEMMMKLIAAVKQKTEWADFKYDVLLFHDIGKSLSEEIIPLVKKEGLFYIPDKYYSFFPKYGNVACSSLPLGMDLAIKEGMLKRGAHVNFLCGAAGVQAGMLSFVY